MRNHTSTLRICILISLLFVSTISSISSAQEPATTPLGPEPATAVLAADQTTDGGLQQRFNTWFTEKINVPLNDVLFFDIYKRPVVDENGVQLLDADGEPWESGLPLIVVVLVLGGIFFTFRFGFVNIRLFRHSIAVIRGKFDKPDDHGEVTHFQALTSALSATVGLGNISGVAVAISAGGPGAVFWMWLTAFFGMSMKFCSCTLAHLYRRIDDDGRVLGGPMVYLHEGFRDVHPGLAPIGRIFAIVFSVFVILAAFGAGNMFQGNQTASIIAYQFFDNNQSLPLKLALGMIMAVMAGVVLIGGIRRIGEITSKLVPLMCLFYCGICLTIILMNAGQVPQMLGSIFQSAFNAEAVFGGFIGVLVMGMRRAAFSNEAGLGSAAIAHAAARTEEPVREGVVAMIGPFIDTIVVCSMTALAILITEAHLTSEIDVEGLKGVIITAVAFSELGVVVPYILCLAVFVFAYSTMISWGYYGERSAEYLFGERGILPYRVFYVAAIVIGPLLSLQAVLDFADIVLLSLAFPNIIGMAIISSKVKARADDYIARLRSGEITPVQ